VKTSSINRSDVLLVNWTNCSKQTVSNMLFSVTNNLTSEASLYTDFLQVNNSFEVVLLSMLKGMLGCITKYALRDV
jgi:hypothetical protein